MEMTMSKLNGVNVDALMETISAVKANPEVADFKFRASNRWLDGGLNRSTVQAFYGACQEDTSREVPFVMHNDEPPVLLGSDQAANPVEYVLHALAGCITTTLVYHAAARGIEVESVRSTYEGYLDLHGFLGLNPNTPRGFQTIRIHFEIEGDLSPEQKEELVQTGRKFSPVHEMISAGVQLEVTVS